MQVAIISDIHDNLAALKKALQRSQSAGKTLVVNPGEIFGALTATATFVIYDTVSGQAKRIDL